MRVIKKVLLFPVRRILMLIGLLVDLIIKAECLVAGVGGLFLVACIIYSIKNQIWVSVGLLVGTIVLGAILLLATAEIKVWIEILIQKLK